MFQKRRRLSKENRKINFKILLFAGILVVGLPIVFALLFHFVSNASFGPNLLINPLSKYSNSLDTKVKDALDKANIKYTKVSVGNDGNANAKLVDGGEIIFAKNKDLNSQIASLQLLLSRLTIEDKKLKSLDFRFASPVVSFN